MSKGSSFWAYFWIVVFAAAMVALGARELQTKFVVDYQGDAPGDKDVLHVLHGGIDRARADFSSAGAESARRKELSAKEQDDQPGWFSKALNSLIPTEEPE